MCVACYLMHQTAVSHQAQLGPSTPCSILPDQLRQSMRLVRSCQCHKCQSYSWHKICIQRVVGRLYPPFSAAVPANASWHFLACTAVEQIAYCVQGLSHIPAGKACPAPFLFSMQCGVAGAVCCPWYRYLSTDKPVPTLCSANEYCGECKFRRGLAGVFVLSSGGAIWRVLQLASVCVLRRNSRLK